MSDVTRPVLRWHGGKWKLAPWIIAHFPPHRVYVEPYGGAASVLMRKSRAYGEVYNDLDKDVVNLFRVLRDESAAVELTRQLQLTPFAKDEFELSYQETADPLEMARRMVIRSFMGFGSNGHNRSTKTGFRANSNRSGTTPAHDWTNYPDRLPALVERLKGVVIENRPAVEVMAAHDSAATLHYVDPPYLFETRSEKMRRNGCYAHEMTAAQHTELLAFLRSLAGMVVLSGYPHQSYDDALPGWRRIDVEAHADGALDRVECLWINPRCLEAIGHGPLFSEAAA